MTDPNVQDGEAIVSRKQAIAAGADFYFTGKPCKHGHTSRRTKHGACCDCVNRGYYENAGAINEMLRDKYANDLAYREAEKERRRLYTIANRGKTIEAARVYRKANPEKARISRNKYKVKRRASDPIFAMAARMQASINKAIRVGGYTKRTRTYEYLGCSYQEFKTHIERQFLKGMTWENRGAWELDHITPQSSAKTEAELFALQHYTNLRPLWTEANRAKGKRCELLI